MHPLRIVNDKAENALTYLPKAKMIFIDPPDNLGLKYNEYVDKIPDVKYYQWLSSVITRSLNLCDVFWISYYWKHDLEIKWMVRNILQNKKWFGAKTFIWRFNFGQHRQDDCGSGFRFLLRIQLLNAQVYTDDIRESSVRQAMGDRRAHILGKVPDDVWEIPRVCGTFKERREWHPTQHPEALMHRIVMMSTREGERVIDLCSGTGTTLRACKYTDRECIAVESDLAYCQKILEENPEAIKLEAGVS